MEVKIISIGDGGVRAAKCPVCGKEIVVVLSSTQPEKDVDCWACQSKLHFSIKDELKERQDEKSS